MCLPEVNWFQALIVAPLLIWASSRNPPIIRVVAVSMIIYNLWQLHLKGEISLNLKGQTDAQVD